MSTMPANKQFMFKLNTGAEIPAIGFGTWQDIDDQYNAVREALAVGYRHIDTAYVYGTEKSVGQAIRDSGIPRGEVFVTTKLWNNFHHPDDVEPALDKSLEELGFDYVDLYLIHFPTPFRRGDTLYPKDGGKFLLAETDYVDTWKAMEKLMITGKVRAIGISNFSFKQVRRILQECSIVPAVHQMEMHPWLQQEEFAAFHKEHNIHVSQYSPFGNQNVFYEKGRDVPRMLEDPVLLGIGKKHQKTSAQIALAWGITRGHSVLPKSKTPERIRENFVGEFRLDQESMEKIKAIDRKLRFGDISQLWKYTLYEDLDGKRDLDRV